MPGSIELKNKNFAFKYDLDKGYRIGYQDVKHARDLQIQATTSKDLLKVLSLGGGKRMLGVAAIGIGAVLLKDYVKLPSRPTAWKSVIFETVIPVDKEDEFDRYITEKLADEMNVLFSNVDTHLRKYLGDEVDKIDDDFLAALKKTKITEVRLCDEEEVQQAKEAGLAIEAEKADDGHGTRQRGTKNGEKETSEPRPAKNVFAAGVGVNTAADRVSVQGGEGNSLYILVTVVVIAILAMLYSLVMNDRIKTPWT